MVQDDLTRIEGCEKHGPAMMPVVSFRHHWTKCVVFLNLVNPNLWCPEHSRTKELSQWTSHISKMSGLVSSCWIWLPSFQTFLFFNVAFSRTLRYRTPATQGVFTLNVDAYHRTLTNCCLIPRLWLDSSAQVGRLLLTIWCLQCDFGEGSFVPHNNGAMFSWTIADRGIAVGSFLNKSNAAQNFPIENLHFKPCVRRHRCLKRFIIPMGWPSNNHERNYSCRCDAMDSESRQSTYTPFHCIWLSIQKRWLQAILEMNPYHLIDPG